MAQTVVRSYRATLNIDFTAQEANSYQKLIAALLQLDWKYVETSAMVIETTDLSTIWRAMDLVGRQCASAGSLSALTLRIQGSRNFAGVKYQAADNHPNALSQIAKKSSPWK